jgi:hypothetical protein
MSKTEQEAALSPMTAGFYTTLVLEGAEKSLAQGTTPGNGATLGATMDLWSLADQQLGTATAAQYKRNA